MNKELKKREFKIPQNILDLINHAVLNLNGKHAKGSARAKKLLIDKKVKYGQLKRIIHDLQNIDKVNERQKYELCGGEQMFNWATQFLKGERDLISGRKDSRKRADDISSINGNRKNSHLTKHKKRFNFKIPVNLIKSNSHKSTITPLKNMKLFEEIKRIKKLM